MYSIILKTPAGVEYVFGCAGSPSAYATMEQAEDRAVDLLDFAKRTKGLSGTELVDIREIG